MGMVSGVPYTSLVEVCTSLLHPARRTASRTFESAADVRIDEGLWSLVAVRNRDQRRQVEDDLDTLAALLHEAGVANISQSHIQAPRVSGSTVSSQPGNRCCCRSRGAHEGAFLHERLGQVAANEAVAPVTEHCGRTTSQRPPRLRSSSVRQTSAHSSSMGNAPTRLPWARSCKEQIRNRKLPAAGYQLEHLWREDVDAGVDQQVHRGFLTEPLKPSVADLGDAKRNLDCVWPDAKCRAVRAAGVKIEEASDIHLGHEVPFITKSGSGGGLDSKLSGPPVRAEPARARTQYGIRTEPRLRSGFSMTSESGSRTGRSDGLPTRRDAVPAVRGWAGRPR